MRVSSATASLDCHEPASLAGHEFGAEQAAIWPQIKQSFHKLNRMMTAIAYAESGNLDAVQQIREESQTKKELGNRPATNGRPGVNGGIEWL